MSKKNGNAAVLEPVRSMIAPPAGAGLAVLDSLPASQFGDDMFSKVASGGYLPRLMLYGSNSDPVKTETTQIGYSLVEGKDNFNYLGRDVDVLVIAWRPKAISMGDQVIANHNPDSPEFKRIQDLALNTKDSNCMYGPEYLVWVPALRKFATFLMGSKTARNESSKMQARLRQAATLKTKLYESKDFKWHGPQILACSTPFDFPTSEELTEVVTAFNNPKESEVEAIQPPAGGEAPRPR